MLQYKQKVGENMQYEFFIAGRARNKENILKICDLFDKYHISYYCFLKNEDEWGYGTKEQTPEERQSEFEKLDLKSEVVLNLFNSAYITGIIVGIFGKKIYEKLS